MPRRKYQRPKVYSWIGKGGGKYWKAEWYQYIEGRTKPKHRAMTWLYKEYSKSEAQEQCDRLVRQETDGPQRPDGSLTVAKFWEQVHFPTLSLRIAENTASSYRSAWKNFIKPALGGTELQHVNKAAIDAILNRMAKDGRAEGSIRLVQSLAHGIFIEAQENGYIIRNPAHRVTVPNAKPEKQTRPLTIEEAQRIFDLPISRGSLMFRVMVLTGARIGEVIALSKADLLPAALRIDESALHGRASSTKNRKVRFAPLPPGLEADLDNWSAQQPGHLVFPNSRGNMDQRASDKMRELIADIRSASKIQDLTPRMCRTTFATLFEGDISDLQSTLGHHSAEFTLEIYRKPITARRQASTEDLEARLTRKVVAMPGRKKESA